MIRRAASALLVLLASACSPPGLLNRYDQLSGSGSGVTRIAEAVAFGDHGQRLDVWRPEATAEGPRPVVIFFYGGGWVSGKRAEYGFAARALAERGFVVVVPDYRKVPDVHFPAFVVDGAQAVKWTHDRVAQFGGDPGRIALMGHSAGAYTVAMLALDRSYLASEGLGPDTIKAGVGLSGPYDFYPFDSPRAIDAMAQAPDPLATQPISFARADSPPLLLVTSDADTVVRKRNSVNLAAKLKSLGAPVELRDYPDLSHEEVVMALSKPFRGKGPVLEDSAAFLDRALAVK
ncbi:alpha/beta hydrolase [Sphingomonas japonica]|uniref:Acetyl esterase/lipase n=1 Tax=Sphingomonas japonica TaxID=511662 RepID=A0ABX0U197_9SPHN|nr:alpha/beta hydrolase [Sphingomonas japonica]NIJ23096.1 acetyl esterase/lipase [Sphingomonas japonica]